MSIIERLERLPLSRFHYILLFLLGIPHCFIAMDFLLISFSLPLLAKEWSLSPTVSGLLVSIVYFGMVIGAFSWGIFSDHFGRKVGLQTAILVYTLFTGFCAVAWDWQSIVAFRFLSGLGIGGFLSLCFVFLSEYIPAEYRGRFLCILDSFWSYGSIVGALLAFMILPKTSWRWLFLVGGAPMLILFLVRIGLPESARFLEAKGKRMEAIKLVEKIEAKAKHGKQNIPGTKSEITVYYGEPAKISVAKLWLHKYRRITIVVWTLRFCMSYGYSALFMWIPTFIAGMGYTLIETYYYIFLTYLAQVPGYLTAAWLTDFIGRKPTLSIYVIFTAVSTFFFGLAKTYVELILWGFAISFFCLGAWAVTTIYPTEVYPTTIRASGSGAAFSFGSIGGIFGSLSGVLSKVLGYHSVLSIVAAVFIIEALTMLTLGIETKGKILEKISQ